MADGLVIKRLTNYFDEAHLASLQTQGDALRIIEQDRQEIERLTAEITNLKTEIKSLRAQNGALIKTVMEQDQRLLDLNEAVVFLEELLIEKDEVA